MYNGCYEFYAMNMNLLELHGLFFWNIQAIQVWSSIIFSIICTTVHSYCKLQLSFLPMYMYFFCSMWTKIVCCDLNEMHANIYTFTDTRDNLTLRHILWRLSVCYNNDCYDGITAKSAFKFLSWHCFGVEREKERKHACFLKFR